MARNDGGLIVSVDCFAATLLAMTGKNAPQ